MTSLKPTPLASAVLFDFDGTLIDSATSILASLRHAFDREACVLREPLGPHLIGPPLRRTLITLVGDDDPALIDRLSQRFKEHYDTAGYRETQVFSGAPEMLLDLQAAGIDLYIVTNKRVAATRRILEHLGWLPWFAGIYALDAFEPPLPNKPAVVAAVLQTHALPRETTWMVGDSAEDQRAADLNGLPFFAARWGYGGVDSHKAAEEATETADITTGDIRPEDLLRALGL